LNWRWCTTLRWWGIHHWWNWWWLNRWRRTRLTHWGWLNRWSLVLWWSLVRGWSLILHHSWRWWPHHIWWSVHIRRSMHIWRRPSKSRWKTWRTTWTMHSKPWSLVSREKLTSWLKLTSRLIPTTRWWTVIVVLVAAVGFVFGITLQLSHLCMSKFEEKL